MPKIKCKCGDIIGLGEIPCPHQYNIISDKEYDKFQGLIDAEELYLSMKIIIKCNKCLRLYIYWNGFDNPPEVYEKEIT